MRPKTVLSVLIILVVAVAVASVFVVRNFNLDDYKNVIAAEATDIVGREVTIRGRLGFVLSWTPTVTAGQVAIANPPWASQDDMLAVDQVAVKFNLIELLKGAVDVSHVEFTGGKLALERAKDGQVNWDLDVTQSDVERTESYLGGDFPYIRRVQIERLDVDYRDLESGEVHTINIDSAKAAVRKNGEKLRLQFDAMVDDQPVFGSTRVNALQGLYFGGNSPITASLVVGAAKLDLDGTIGARDGKNALDVSFTSSGPEVADLFNLAGYRIPSVGPFEVTGRLIGHEEGSELQDIDARVGRSDLKGNIRAYPRDPPVMNVNLTSGVLDLTPLFRDTDVVDAEEPVATGQGEEIYSDDSLSLDRLATADVDLKLTIDRIVLRDSWFKVAELGATLKDGNLKVDTFKLDYKNATLTGRGAIESGAKPVVKFRLLTQNFDLGGFLQEQNVTDVVAGDVDFGMDVTAKGDSAHALVDSLNGTASFVSGHGEIASRYIDLLAVDLTRLLMPWDKTLTEAKVTCALGQVKIKDGVVKSQALLLDTEKMRMKAFGHYTLETDDIDLLLWPRPKDPALVTLATPLRLKGIVGEKTTLQPAAVGLAIDAAEAAAGVLLFGPAGILIPFASLGAGHQHDCVNDLQKVFGPKIGTELVDDSTGGADSPGFDSTATAAVGPMPSEVLFPIAGDQVTPDILINHLTALGFTKITKIEKEGSIFHCQADWNGKVVKLRVDANLGQITAQQ
ncbi:MAG: AsmA family protein [Pseudomonadota bacterium]